MNYVTMQENTSSSAGKWFGSRGVDGLRPVFDADTLEAV